MKKSTGNTKKIKKSIKKIPLKSKQNRLQSKSYAEEINDINQQQWQEQLNQENYDNQNQNENQNENQNGKISVQQFQSPQQKRIRLAKKLLQDIQATNKANKIKDDFFIINQEEQERQDGFKGIQRDNHDDIDNLLREDYMKKNSLYYERIASTYKTNNLKQAIIYKGHTKTITALQICPSNTIFYSCSKDGSLIKWDKQTKKKTFLSFGKEANHHQGQILCMSLNTQGTILATGGSDATIKLWDTQRNLLIDTLKSHKSDINGLKFGTNSNNLCSVSSDKTFKLWDGAERVFIDTFFGHRQQALDIDCINARDFISCGFDSQVITWRTQKQTQVVYSGHDYSIDKVRMINPEHFLTASQDQAVFLWSTKKKKPLFKLHNAHQNNWICSLGNIYNSDLFFSGAYNQKINMYQLNQGFKGFTQIGSLPCKGIVNDIKIKGKNVYLAQGQQHRLGRWFTKKQKNQIRMFQFEG